ncbi:MAG: PepSY-like domain-containing protein [Puia sp.]|nr:PepSY-like domain-containing protein [Puia sp.]
MKKTTFLLIGTLTIFNAYSQDLKEKDVPPVVKSALMKQFPKATKVSWEKEKGNFEANWGGKSGEDNSAQFTPAGNFVELVESIPVSSLPARVAPYVSAHYKGAAIREAGKVTDAAGKHSIEVEIKGKDLIFDTEGNFVKEDK